MTISNSVRGEYPRSQFERKEWLNLSGEWDFKYAKDNVGEKEQWYKQTTLNIVSDIDYAEYGEGFLEHFRNREQIVSNKIAFNNHKHAFLFSTWRTYQCPTFCGIGGSFNG